MDAVGGAAMDNIGDGDDASIVTDPVDHPIGAPPGIVPIAQGAGTMRFDASPASKASRLSVVSSRL